MRHGFRPRVIRQIFSPVPAARSRCLSTFVAISRQGLPTTLRYEPSHVLAASSLLLLVLGGIIQTVSRIGGTIVLSGWMVAGLSLIALLFQDKWVYGFGRPRLLRQLDEARRTVGLDEALLPESLDFLETAAQQWERVEHALQSRIWDQHDDLRNRINYAAHQAMEDVVVLECGTTGESGFSDQDAEQALTTTSANLRLLADAVDATASAIMAYPRDNYESNGESPHGIIEEVHDLEQALARLNQSRTRSPQIFQGMPPHED